MEQQKRNIWAYLKKYKFWIAAYIILTIVAGVGDVFFSILIAKSVEYITLSNFKMTLWTLFTVVCINLGQRVCWYCLNLIYFKQSNKIMAELNLDLAKQAFKLNSKTFNDHDSGTFVQRIVEDPARIVDSLASIVDNLMEIMSGVIIIIYVATLNIYITLGMAVLLAIGFALERMRVKKRRKNRVDVRKKADTIQSLTTEIVHSEKDIKSLGLEEKLSEVSKENYQTYQRARYKLEFTDANFWTVRNIVLGIGGLLLLMMGVWLMDLGTMTLATFMIVYSNRGQLYSLVSLAGMITNNIVDISVSHRRMFALFDEEEFVTEKFGTQELESTGEGSEIEFKDVSFTYKEYEYAAPQTKDMVKRPSKRERPSKKLVSEKVIFENLSFKVERNQTVAFVGKSGSGKSTILNLMSKMYEADSGQVLIDGKDVTTLNKQSLRRTISLVNQFPYIFDMTIKENLLLAKANATDEELHDAIRRSALEEFVDSLPLGMDTKVGESGIKLSGGQKQRLAIARALLRNSNIILFDESTSSLDNFAQGDVKKSIDMLKGKSTVVIVAHRLTTIKDADHIFFLDNGKIVDEGTFDQLFKRNKKFKAMFLAENI